MGTNAPLLKFVSSVIVAFWVSTTDIACAQQVITPALGTFEDFVKKRIGGGQPEFPFSENLLEKYSFGALSLAESNADIATTMRIKPPDYPCSLPLSKLPEGDQRTQNYVEDIRQFLQLRSRINHLERQYLQVVNRHKELQALALTG